MSTSLHHISSLSQRHTDRSRAHNEALGLVWIIILNVPINPPRSQRRLGLVLEDVLNLTHDLVCQLGQQPQRLAVVVDLLRLGCSEDDGAYVLAAPTLISKPKLRSYEVLTFSHTTQARAG
jgi:hypothetical protein